MESLLTMNDIAAVASALKQEMDQSYKKEESGIYSNTSAESKADSSWECFDNEITDPSSFDPPIQSSNLACKMVCNISSITEDEFQNKGMILFVS